MARKKKIRPIRKPAVFMPCLVRFCRLDRAALLLGGVIIVTALLAAGKPYKLSGEDPYGFLLWFLLILGHLPMELLEFLAKLTGMDAQVIENFIENREALLLGACNLCVLAATWAILRFYVLKRWGAEPLRIASIFFRLLFFWGVFQLLCFFSVKNWSDGKVNPLHRDLKKVNTEQVRK